MKDITSLKNQLLIAMPNLTDGDFRESVTLICEHNAEGAMGIVINQPLGISTIELLEHMSIPCNRSRNIHPVMAGGPVQTDRGFVVHRSEKLWKSSIHLDDDIAITTSSDILHAIGQEEIPDDAFVALGYAGWGPGQLESEMLSNSWLNIPVKSEIVFEANIETRWKKAANSLGFDIEQLSFFSGNA